MNRKKRIYSILSQEFKDCKIVLKDISYFHKGHNNFDGKQETHFSVILIPENNFESKLATHKKINNLLKSEFNSGLHALEIKIMN